MQSILVGIDFHASSINAAHYAVNLAKLFNAKIILFHAYIIPVSLSDFPVPLLEENDIEVELTTRLKQLSDDLKRVNYYTGDIVSACRPGNVPETLDYLCREYEVGLIVVGLKKKHNWLERIGGSTVYRILDNIMVPVITVPEHQNFKFCQKRNAV
ncbi:MAG: hypothetical protein A3G23_13930 [Bacteroidetes bacterium RIFCSPLOWO2_12_FULL_37_12]|nr:MAG: hypothetical protein A3G23_13930 [Bacteroidetes bacterium RIFCSPLOWO2_12_FULL_37_12]